MNKLDAIIIGGGPAGSTCAWKMRQAGFDVLILDKKNFPRDKTCAGWITPAVVESLQLDLDDYAKTHVLQPLTGFRTSMLGKPEVFTNYGETVSYGIRRCEFDHYLLQRCAAPALLQQPVKSVVRAGKRWVINDQLRAPLVIGAGGHFCPVAKHLGAKTGGSEPIVAAKEIEFLMTGNQKQQCQIAAEVPELFFCTDLKGYGWVFRKGDYLNIGLGRQDNYKLSAHLTEFVQHLKQKHKIPADIPEHFHGHAYLLYGDAPRTLLDDGMLLIGDAAGLAYAQSGEGIRPAIESALMAADLITHLDGDYCKANLQDYVNRLCARFGERDRHHHLAINRILPKRLIHFLAGKMLSNPWFSRHLTLDRWFFHVDQQPLKL